MRRYIAAAGLLVITVLLTSCLRVDGTIKIEDDGTGRVDFISAIDADAIGDAFGGFGGASSEICASFEQEAFGTQELPSNAQVTTYDEDGFCGISVEFALEQSLDHSDSLFTLVDPSARLYKDGDNWFFESDFSTEEVTSEASGFDMDMATLFDDAYYRLTVDLPGRAVEGGSNATQVGSDGRFRWDIDVLNPPARLFAQTEPGSGGGDGGSFGDDGGGFGRIMLALAALTIVGAAALFWFTRRSGDSTATAAPANPPLDVSPAGHITPPAGALKETVVMPVADAQPVSFEPEPRAATDPGFAVQPAEAAQPVDAAQPVQAPQPVYDAALGAWTIHDPVRGHLRHDTATDTWLPI